MALELGETVGGYEFLQVLSTSPTGVTYKVRNHLAQRFEVLKVLPKELQQDRERVERFLREAKIHAGLRHPHIASFHNAAEMDGRLVMTAELVEGMSLAQRLQDGPIDVETAIDCGLQVLSALAYAHENGVVHRNLTPSNIIIAADGTIKVTGFELAKSASDPELTMTGVVMGSMEYISPEQVKGVVTPDPRSDLYTVGVLLYELVTGRKLFDFKSKFEIMQAHVQMAPGSPREVRLDLPAEFERAILTALAKDPAERFQSAREFRRALERIKAGPDHSEPGNTFEAPAPSAAAATATDRVRAVSLQGTASPFRSLGQRPGNTGGGTTISPFYTEESISFPRASSRGSVKEADAWPPGNPVASSDLAQLIKVGVITFLVATAVFVGLVLVFDK